MKVPALLRVFSASAAVATAIALAGCASTPGPATTVATRESANTTPMIGSSIGPADIAAVRALAWRLSTRHGARVQVVRAHGRDVWAKFYPDWTDYGGTESRIKSIDVLVVRSTDHLPLGQDSETPGTTPAPIGARSVIIDPISGGALTRSDAGVDRPDKFDNTVFGQTTDVTLP